VKKYETERLILNPTSVKDAEFVLELMNTPKWLKYIGDRGVKTLQDAEKYIEANYVVQRKRLGFSTYTVISKKDREKLGLVGLYDREGISGIDLGFAFLEKYEGQGYAQESSEKLLNLAYEEFGISELKAITNTDNIASQKLLKRLGFKEIGLTKLSKEKDQVLLFLKERST
jgi:RimJ/RimL family protein N-acetyltransferase